MNAYEKGAYELCGSYTSYTPTGKSLFVKAGRTYGEPKRGDIVYYYDNSLKRVAHVGLVTNVDRVNKTFDTIEGNTSSNNLYERNGGCVARKTAVSYVKIGGTNRVNCFCRPRYSYTSIAKVIEIAENELGYVEKASNKSIGKITELATPREKRANIGSSNWTKYGEWYGLNGNAWCQMFISWIFYMAAKFKVEESTSKYPKWIQKGKIWYYALSETIFVKNAWRFIDGRWYAFDGAGKMLSATWFKSGESWYYLGVDGGMLSSQWFEYKSKWYYLDKSGAMAINCYVGDDKNGYSYINAEGIWDPTKDILKKNDLPVGSIVVE